jgi:hypothetical protein
VHPGPALLAGGAGPDAPAGSQHFKEIKLVWQLCTPKASKRSRATPDK